MLYVLYTCDNDGIEEILGVSQDKERLQKIAKAYDNTDVGPWIDSIDDLSAIELPNKWIYRVRISQNLERIFVKLMNGIDHLDFQAEQNAKRYIDYKERPWYEVFVFAENVKEARNTALTMVKESFPDDKKGWNLEVDYAAEYGW